jgi:hypothetical protein
MSHDRLDRILMHEDELLPSSGFLTGVMDRVREEAAAPPPIPVPWRRALPGAVLAVGVFLWALISFAGPAFRALRSLRLDAASAQPLVAAAGASAPLHTALWLVFALLAGLFGVFLAARLGRRSGLL